MMDKQTTQMQYLGLNDKQKNIFIDLHKAIKENRRKQFDKALKIFKKEIVKNHTLELITKTNPNKGLFIDLFQISLKSQNKHYQDQLYELNNQYSFFPNESTELLRMAIQENNVEIAEKCLINGANLTELDSLCTTPIEEAIRSNNLEIICMLLYYGGYTNNFEDNLTSFMFSIICQCSEDIQRILMEYETDYNLCCDHDSTLFMALKYGSPLALELIERGANPNFIKPSFRGTVIAPLQAILYKCNVEVVRELWRIFDYSTWIHNTAGTSPSSVILRFLRFYCWQGDIQTMEYFKMFLENEEKLRLEIEHHENVQRTSLVAELWRISVTQHLFDEEFIQNVVLHLLSHGATIYINDIDKLYSLSLYKESNFLDQLLFMDLYEDPTMPDLVTFMYFKYTLMPDVDEFISKLILFQKNQSSNDGDVLDAMKKLSQLFALDYPKKRHFEDLVRRNERLNSSLKNIRYFPSLLQLSRDASRIALLNRYGIQTIRQFYDTLNRLNVSHVIKSLLSYKQRIYMPR